MKYVREMAVIFGITLVGEILNLVVPLPIPAGVYGLFLLLALLCTGVISLPDVEHVGGLLLDLMPLMFIPAGVGLINSWDLMKSILIPLTVITAVSTVFVMAVTGKTAQYLIRKRQQK
mgnify:CR=1 FL=1